MLYDQHVKNFRRENGSAVAIPVFISVKSPLYECRSSKQSPVSKTLEPIDVHCSLTGTLMNQNLLFCSNILVHTLGFASPTTIQFLGANPHWNSDGTFRTCAPRPSYQSYSIHIWDAYSMKSVVYAALPNRKDSTYDIFLNELIAYAQSTGVSLSPKLIVIDFETAAYNAFSKNFSMATVKGCQFRFPAKYLVTNKK